MGLELVTGAYSARALAYIEAVGSIEHASQEDRTYLLEWARTIDGPMLDVGCGPGQWTNFLHGAGIDVEGVDPTSRFLEEAAARYPQASFRAGRAEDLGARDGALGGILAWFSLIHTPPEMIHESLADFARCLRPGGGLAVGFFVGPAREPFDHAIATAYYWSVADLSEQIEHAGFTVTDAQIRTPPGERAQGKITARSS